MIKSIFVLGWKCSCSYNVRYDDEDENVYLQNGKKEYNESNFKWIWTCLTNCIIKFLELHLKNAFKILRFYSQLAYHNWIIQLRCKHDHAMIQQILI